MPGLNAPIPPGAAFGYHAGGWGKPPVNESGEPLYGDVFAQNLDEDDDEQASRALSTASQGCSMDSMIVLSMWLQQPAWISISWKSYFHIMSVWLLNTPARL